MTRIVFLTSHLPFPPFSGGRRREYELLNRLKELYEIELCIVTQTFESDKSHLGMLKSFRGAQLFRSDLHSPLSNGEFQCLRYVSQDARRFLRERLAQGDVSLVHCEGFYMRQLLDEANIPVFLMEQNVEYLVWPNTSDELRREEEEVWRLSTMCGAITEEDAEIMREVVGCEKVMLCFNGCDHVTSVGTSWTPESEVDVKGPIILSVGNFAYGPTYEAGEVMCSSVAPEILRRFKDATVLLVGNEAQRLHKFVTHERCKIIGPVPSLEPYYRAATVVALPLARGRGISVKTVEALARGCAVVTTEVGQRGLLNAPVSLANSLDSFVQRLCELLSDQHSRQELRKKARLFSAQLPTWHMAAERLAAAWELTRKARTPRLAK